MQMVPGLDPQVELETPGMFVQLLTDLIVQPEVDTPAAGAKHLLLPPKTACSLHHLPNQPQGVVHRDHRNPRGIYPPSHSDTSHALTQSAQQGVWIHGNGSKSRRDEMLQLIVRPLIPSSWES